MINLKCYVNMYLVNDLENIVFKYIWYVYVIIYVDNEFYNSFWI